MQSGRGGGSRVEDAHREGHYASALAILAAHLPGAHSQCKVSSRGRSGASGRSHAEPPCSIPVSIPVECPSPSLRSLAFKGAVWVACIVNQGLTLIRPGPSPVPQPLMAFSVLTLPVLACVRRSFARIPITLNPRYPSARTSFIVVPV